MSFIVYIVRLRRFACRPAAFLAVWRGQTKDETRLDDFKAHIALLRVLVGLLAKIGEASGIGGHTVFEVSVVGVYLGDGLSSSK